MKVLITGSNGLLGQNLLYKLISDDSICLIATSIGENRLSNIQGYDYFSLDITNQDHVESIILEKKPDVVINTAAMTNVDLCEYQKEQCNSINVDAVKYLADACVLVNAHLVHISTDFVFDGKLGPYSEEDNTNPLSYYGLSKLKSENLLHNHSVNYTIIRTMVLFGKAHSLSSNNIFFWVKRSLSNGEKLKIVDDQFRCPTLAADLADGCILAFKKKEYGLFHISGKEVMSIYEMVKRIANYYGYDKNNINRISTNQLKQKAIRPLKTGFVLDKAITVLGYKAHTFEESLSLIE